MILYIILGVGILAAGGLLVYGFVVSRNQPSVVQERLGRYTEAGAKQASPEAQGGLTTSGKRKESTLSVWLNDFLRERSFFAQGQGNINAADLKINVGEFFALCLLTGLGGVVLGALLTVL